VTWCNLVDMYKRLGEIDFHYFLTLVLIYQTTGNTPQKSVILLITAAKTSDLKVVKIVKPQHQILATR
jgi:hypothetical protein